jgi:hypothetical protein
MRNILLSDLAAEWTEEEARLVLDDWRRSGQTIAAFARERHMSAPRLYWWRKRLPKDGAPPPVISLVPAKVVMRSETAAVVIRMPSGVAIELADASPTLVAAIVGELERSS